MTTATAAGPTMELMQQINDAFNARDPERIATFFADDATFFMARGPEPCGRRVHGRDAIKKVLADRFKVIPDDALGSHRSLHHGHPGRLGVDGHRQGAPTASSSTTRAATSTSSAATRS